MNKIFLSKNKREVIIYRNNVINEALDFLYSPYTKDNKRFLNAVMTMHKIGLGLVNSKKSIQKLLEQTNFYSDYTLKYSRRESYFILKNEIKTDAEEKSKILKELKLIDDFAEEYYNQEMQEIW
jgi:hypothetical protein